MGNQGSRPAGSAAGSWASSAGVRRSMQSNGPRDTSLEVAVRSALHQAGYRFRKHVRPIPEFRCEPDIVFTSRRVVVFLDGCYWHSCPEHATFPKTNESWWRAKLARNVERDRGNDRALIAHGWTVVRVWEHEPVPDAVDKIRVVLGSKRPEAAKVNSRKAAPPRRGVR